MFKVRLYQVFDPTKKSLKLLFINIFSTLHNFYLIFLDTQLVVESLDSKSNILGCASSRFNGIGGDPSSKYFQVPFLSTRNTTHYENGSPEFNVKSEEVLKKATISGYIVSNNGDATPADVPVTYYDTESVI